MMPLDYIQVEITTLCNARCRYCSQSKISDNTNQHSMDIKSFNILLDRISGFTNNIHLQGVGEPLMHKDFESIIFSCKQKNLTTSTTTNGTLLGHVNLECLDELYISLDSIEQWEDDQRLGIIPEQVVENLDDLLAQNRHPRIYLTSVVRDTSVAQVAKVLNYVHTRRTQISGVVLVPVLDIYASNDLLSPNVRREIATLTRSFSHLPIFDDAVTNTDDSIHSCGWLFDKLYFDVHGILRVCCVRGGNSNDIALGSIFSDGLKTLLSQDHFLRLMQRMRREDHDAICEKCIESGLCHIWR